jgi:thioredoxin-related protein
MRWIAYLALFFSLQVQGQEAPAWFVDSFLDIREDVAEAAKDGKRLMLYFGQDGCPYCRRLMEVNFRQQPIVERMRRAIVPMEINLWGDREVTWTDGRKLREKDFAKMLKIQFTPTLLFFDEKGGIALRLNGYYPPHQFQAALDYVSGRLERKTSFSDYMKKTAAAPASAALLDQPFLLATRDLSRRPGGKPLAVLFETADCAGCDELHKVGFAHPQVLREIGKFDVVRFSASDNGQLLAPSGKATSAARFFRELKIAYVPSIVLFDNRGREAFRIEAYVRPFHLAGAFDYVASGEHRREPSFQRFLQARSERLKAQGNAVDLWN